MFSDFIEVIEIEFIKNQSNSDLPKTIQIILKK